jgi:membrane protease YdiL (CAAX protease family)
MINNAFIDPARQGKNNWWRYVVTLVTGFGLDLVFSLVLLLGFYSLEHVFSIEKLSSNALLVLSMAPFTCLLLALWAGIRFLHHRPFRSLFGKQRSIQWRRLAFSGIIWFLLAGTSDLLTGLVRPGSVSWSFDAAKFFPFLLLALVFTPIQTSTEELIFRGYITQGVGLKSKTIWGPLLIPAVIFGLLHSMNPEVGLYGFWVMMAYYIGFGVFLGWVTLRSKSLDLALGIHLANNLYSALIVTYPDSAIPSPALFTSNTFNPALSVVILTISALIYIWLMRPGIEG